MKHVCLAVALAFGTLAASPPPSYTEEPITVPSAAGSLSGALLIPNGSGPFPVALIIAGSGPTDRDGNSAAGLTTDAYKLLAQGLAAHGIATLRYDKRGIGASTSTQHEADARFDDFVDDALALTHRLESDARFSRVAVIGHSEGSLIGMLTAQRDPKVRAFVALEGAGRRLSDIVNEQVRAMGTSPAVVDEVVAYNRSLVAGNTIPSPDPALAALFRPSVQPYLISEYRYDPAAILAKLTIPVLIVQGTTDLQVSMTDAKLLAKADPHAKLDIVTGMNHILRDAPADRTANIATYSEPLLPLDAALVPAISTFILSAH